MKYIDVLITTHSTDESKDLDQIIMPTHIAKDLEAAGWTVRSTIVLDHKTGLTGNYRNEKVQHRIEKEAGH
ncbi:hypothetical protein GUMBALL_45 [Mycobacterium phage Gumball]|uniref:Uncharacterized protein n=4 Tax=Plotvirus plot TaxID=2170099 RepID=A0A5P8DB65_9CAUD|nr:gp47 [Mycobacterium phage Gumball]ACI06419.1 hypothetical protein GUMBALL_45 [Mycobacterium phage Gumball]AEK10256.1 hypothetical protein PBI_SIRHARLEY_47 [Mycobacterium phage SirHarley]QBJ04762.1 hypothetical protein SEA_DELTON_47 [Mycobacterium phage Delton]QFP95971.1 hypothetical protein SEA_HELPFUL_49 [Mycobacterium phage Helpful]